MTAFFRFVAINALILTLIGCNLANMVKMRYANDDLVPLWPENHHQQTLPTYYGGEKPHIDVTINGVDGFRLLLDTGASITYLADTPKVRALNLSKGYDLTAKGWGDGQDTPIYQSEVNQLSLEGVTFDKVNVAILEASKSPYYLREDEAVFDGVLGHDILRHFSWSFDKKNQKITISNQAYKAQADDVAIPFEVAFSKLVIEGKFDLGVGEPVTEDLLIDTGSRHYLKLSQNYLENRDIVVPGKYVTAADFGLSGRALHQRVTLPSFTMGEQSFQRVKTNLIVTEDEDDLWVVGSALLNQFVSVIDYHSEVMYLRPYEQHTFETRYNLLGLELRKIRGGEFVVRYVMPDMAMEKQDIKEGDLITRINGIAANKMTQDQWLTLSSQPGDYEVCRMREQETCLNVVSKHIEGYSTVPTAQSAGSH